MPRDLRLYFHDAREACRLLADFTRGKTLTDYQSDALLRSAVERQFAILGEALFQAEKLDPTLPTSISNLRQIINFRHILIHGYHAIQNDIVWGILENDLATLVRELDTLMAAASPEGAATVEESD